MSGRPQEALLAAIVRSLVPPFPKVPPAERPTRAVVKRVRSCALFAWFDHPRVGPALGAAPTH